MIENAYVIGILIILLIFVVILTISAHIRINSISTQLKRTEQFLDEIYEEFDKDNEYMKNDIRRLQGQVCNFRDVYVKDLLYPWSKK